MALAHMHTRKIDFLATHTHRRMSERHSWNKRSTVTALEKKTLSDVKAVKSEIKDEHLGLGFEPATF